MDTAATPGGPTAVGASSVQVRRALTVGGLGAAALAFGAGRASAAESDVLTLMADLETGAVAAYTAAAGLPFIRAIENDVVQTFLSTSLTQHKEALRAIETAGGTPSADLPDEVSTGLGLDKTPSDTATTLGFAINLEGVIIASTSQNSSADLSPATRVLLGQLGASAGQRQAVLRAVGVLVTGDALDLVALPPDTAKLPADAGKVGFPDSFAKTSSAIKAG